MALPRLLTRGLVTAGALTGLTGAFLVGTTVGSPDGGPVGGPTGWRGDATAAAYTGSDLTPARDCDELLDWYVDRALDLVGPYGWSTGGPVYLDGALEGDVAVPDVASGAVRELAAAGPAPVRATNEGSGTNVQEAGVDEPDVVKTDGHTLYQVEAGRLVTYDLTGSEVVRLDSYDLPGAGAVGAELLLSGTTVVVLTQDGDRQGPTTELVTFDAADPAHLVQTHTATYRAALVTARLHDGVVRVVVSTGLPALDFATDRESTRANQEVVRASTIEDWLPSVAYDGGPDQPLVDCVDVAVPDGDDARLGSVTVVGFDAAAPQAPSVSGLAVDTQLAYASTDQLYLATYPSFGGPVVDCWGCLAPQPLERGGIVDRLVPDWVTGSGERESTDTHLYAFDLDGITTTFAASGSVDGTVRDRWSMDAADSVLRVAVGTGSDNAVVTFRQQGNDLVEAGRLDDLGRGEQLQSVRWFDTLAIVVTFRQVDPLYAVDLTDPDEPTLLGELKVPGFSAYLHPLGERRLLGIGQGPQADGGWGAQAGLFDVTDLTDPQRLDAAGYGAGSTAFAAQDPRQLTWLPDGRTVLTVVADGGYRPAVSVLTLGEGQLTNTMVEVDATDDPASIRLVPLEDGRVVLASAGGAEFFAPQGHPGAS